MRKTIEQLKQDGGPYVVNCLIILRADQKDPIFTALPDGNIEPRLDRYAIVPREYFEKLRGEEPKLRLIVNPK